MNSKILTAIGVVVVVLLGIVAFKPAQETAVKVFGASANGTTAWSSDGSFSGDLAVGGALTVTGATTLTGAVSGNFPNTSVITMTSGTTTPCAVRNTSGSTRTLVAIGTTERGTTASLGAIRFTAGTGTTAFATSYYTKFLNGALNTKVSGVDTITTTSTLMSAYSPWRNNEWLVFYSATTVHAGTCRVVYY